MAINSKYIYVVLIQNSWTPKQKQLSHLFTLFFSKCFNTLPQNNLNTPPPLQPLTHQTLRNCVYFTNLNFLISSQPDGVNLFQTYITWSNLIHSLKYLLSTTHCVAKINELENQSLWQKLNFVANPFSVLTWRSPLQFQAMSYAEWDINWFTPSDWKNIAIRKL